MAACPPSKMPDEQADAIAAYVMSLKQPAGTPPQPPPLPGDPAAGERFFTGKGNCANCHMVRGRGGVLGPDLSNIGRDRRPAQIEQALRDPGAAPAAPAGRGGRGGRGAVPAYRAVTVRLRDGQTLAGHREEREHLRPATAGRRWQAASAVERPGRGDRARKIADAEGGSDRRWRCATWSPTSAAFRPIRMRRRCSRRANSGRVFRSPKWRSPSPAPGPLTTAT